MFLCLCSFSLGAAEGTPGLAHAGEVGCALAHFVSYFIIQFKVELQVGAGRVFVTSCRLSSLLPPVDGHCSPGHSPCLGSLFLRWPPPSLLRVHVSQRPSLCAQSLAVARVLLPSALLTLLRGCGTGGLFLVVPLAPISRLLWAAAGGNAWHSFPVRVLHSGCGRPQTPGPLHLRDRKGRERRSCAIILLTLEDQGHFACSASFLIWGLPVWPEGTWV